MSKEKTDLQFLVIDPQARGHSLACLLASADDVQCVYLARHNPLPDNHCGEIIPLYWIEELQPDTYPEIIRFCLESRIDCVIVCTADAMAAGLTDALQSADITVIGANRNSLKLEDDKYFAKRFFNQHAIPTPDYVVCQSLQEIRAVNDHLFPCFIKSDRIIRSHYSAVKVTSKQQALDVAVQIFSIQKNYYGRTSKVILEQLCEGRELSFTVLLSGIHWLALPTCRDYKTLNNGNWGVNTSGMGAFAPIDDINSTLYQTIVTLLIQPVITNMHKKRLSYNGFLYFGIIIDSNNQPHLLELNCRLGDPEAQAMCALLSAEFPQIIWQAANGCLKNNEVLPYRSGYSCSVYAVPLSYPEKSRHFYSVALTKGLSVGENYQYHFGDITIKGESHTLITGHKRTFSVTAWGETLESARDMTYRQLKTIKSAGLHYRDDIGAPLSTNNTNPS